MWSCLPHNQKDRRLVSGSPLSPQTLPWGARGWPLTFPCSRSGGFSDTNQQCFTCGAGLPAASQPVLTLCRGADLLLLPWRPSTKGSPNFPEVTFLPRWKPACYLPDRLFFTLWKCASHEPKVKSKLLVADTNAYNTAMLVHDKPWAWDSRSEGDTEASLVPYAHIRCLCMCRGIHVLHLHTFPHVHVSLCHRSKKSCLLSQDSWQHVLFSEQIMQTWVWSESPSLCNVCNG